MAFMLRLFSRLASTREGLRGLKRRVFWKVQKGEAIKLPLYGGQLPEDQGNGAKPRAGVDLSTQSQEKSRKVDHTLV